MQRAVIPTPLRVRPLAPPVNRPCSQKKKKVTFCLLSFCPVSFCPITEKFSSRKLQVTDSHPDGKLFLVCKCSSKERMRAGTTTAKLVSHPGRTSSACSHGAPQATKRKQTRERMSVFKTGDGFPREIALSVRPNAARAWGKPRKKTPSSWDHGQMGRDKVALPRR